MKGTAQEPQLRLHGWSWLFKASTALKELALPLLAFLVLKREEEPLLLGVTVGVALLALVWGLLRARSFRYEIRADEVVVRDGMLVRELRHVPFSRVQSVSERRGPVHRLLGVTELVLESGTGGKPEAVLQVLSPAAAVALAGALRLHRAAAGSAGVPPAAAAEPLLVLPTSELLRLGLVSNRGFVVVLMAAGAASQSIELLRALPGLRDLGPAIDDGLSEAAAAGLLPLALWLGALLLFALVLVRVLSLGHALLTQHGFTLTRDGTRLRVRRGLLTRIDVSGRTDAIQRLVLERNPL
ncbi:MAG: PH domain-containing protein, partial [Rubrivivax sp.]